MVEAAYFNDRREGIVHSFRKLGDKYDIGCGMEVVMINKKKEEINFDHLDETIRQFVPSGFRIRDKEHRFSKMIDFDSVRAPFTLQRAQKSIGTLGGGNHFVELNEDDKGMYSLSFIVVLVI